MNWLDRLTVGIAPRWTMQRVAARATIARLYDAAKTHHQHKTPTNGRRSGDGVMEHARDKVNLWARSLDENHDLVTGLLSMMANNVAQMEIEPMVKSKGGELNTVANDQLADLFQRWRDDADSTGTLGWTDLCHITARTWFRDGEVFVNHLQGVDGEYLPYAIEVLEPDFCPFDLTRGDSPSIIHGIEKDNTRGRPVAGWFYREHPGNQDHVARFRVPSLDDLVRVPATNMSHVKFVRRLHQTRGISVLHSVVHRLDDINEYEASERIAARVAASISLFLTTAPNWGIEQSVNAASGEVPYEMDAGQVYRLNPGENIEAPASSRPNPELMNFRRAMLRAVAAGTGTRYSTLARDYSDGSYSSQRQELVESRPFDVQFRNSWESQFLKPMWRRFVQAAMVAGKVSMVGANPETFFDMQTAGVAIPWIDIAKEVRADAEAVNAGFKSRQQVVREHGLSLREIDRERKQDTQPGIAPLETVHTKSERTDGTDSEDSDENNVTA